MAQYDATFIKGFRDSGLTTAVRLDGLSNWFGCTREHFEHGKWTRGTAVNVTTTGTGGSETVTVVELNDSDN